MFIFEKNPKNLQKPVEYTRFDGSLHSTVVDHCTISYGTGRVVGTVSYTRTSTAGYYIQACGFFVGPVWGEVRKLSPHVSAQYTYLE